MKGIILAGGSGTRLRPMTIVTNKHLIPVYDKPMVYYPLYTLVNAGVKDILIITGKEHAGDFLELLGSGKDFGVNFTFRLQDEAGGIAQALGLAEKFVGEDRCIVILGDNIFDDNLKPFAEKFEKADSAYVFLKEVKDPERFGVAELDKKGKVISIVEKPKQPKSNLAVTGLYMYTPDVFKIVKTLKPSGRGELEITDVNNAYLKQGRLNAVILKGFWSDAGTVTSLFNAAKFIESKGDKNPS